MTMRPIIRTSRWDQACQNCRATIPAGSDVQLTKLPTGGWYARHPEGYCAGEEPPATFAIPAVETVEVEGTPSDELYAHQAAVVAAVKDGARSILLADEPGLGKTATALIASAAAGAERVLVIAPAVVKIAWQREAATWLPGRTVQVLNGRKASAIADDTDVVIINYDVLTAWQESLAAWAPQALIVDEAHMIKNSRAARAKAVAEIAEALPADALRMLLTGTPIPNAPIDLAHPLRVLGVLDAVFGGFWPFAKRYAGAFHSGYGWDMSGATNLEELHEKLVGSCMVRRRKADVLDLPERLIVDVPVELTGAGARGVKAAQKALVDVLVAAVREVAPETRALTPAMVGAVVRAAISSKGGAFAELAALRRELGAAKADLVVAQAEDLLEAGEPVVVMVHHREVQDLVAAALADHGVVRIHGGQDPEDRQAAIDQFQAGDASVCVASIQAAGVGITLHRASQVIIGELPWTAAAQTQAIDRVHRIGQDEPVTAWRVIAAATLDERMAEVIGRKAGISLAAVDGGDQATGEEELTAAAILTELVLDRLGITDRAAA